MSRNSSQKSFTAIKSVQRAQEVREQLLSAIERGDFKAGDRLPSERELGEAFGVSRVSVREAIRGLEAIGLVEVVHGRGTFVAEGPGDRYRAPFSDWLEVHRDELLDLMKVRGALDELAAAEAAAHADKRSLADLNESAKEFAAAGESDAGRLDEIARRDIAFHLSIAKASGSPLLLDLLEDLNTLLEESRKAVFASPAEVARSIQQHEEIVAAIMAADPAGARAAVARHIASSVKATVDGNEQ